MKPGPKVKTDAQKKHEGTFRSGRANPAPEPAACARMPSTLSTGAKAVWKRLAPSLAQLSMLTTADRDVFVLYCEWVATAEEAAKGVKAGAFIFETASGHRQVSPDLTVFKQASEMVIKLADRFGLTPTSTTSILINVGFLASLARDPAPAALAVAKAGRLGCPEAVIDEQQLAEVAAGNIRDCVPAGGE